MHDEPSDKERISVRLFLDDDDDARETESVLGIGVEHVGDHEVDAFACERTDVNLSGAVDVAEIVDHGVEFLVGFVVTDGAKEKDADLLGTDDGIQQSQR